MSQERTVSCYLSVPIRRSDEAAAVEAFLTERGFGVLNPCRIVPRGATPETMPAVVSTECYRMMGEADCTVLLMGEGADFGRDCAVEVGWALGSGKPVIGFGRDMSRTEKSLRETDGTLIWGSLTEVVDGDLEALAGTVLRLVKDRESSGY